MCECTVLHVWMRKNGYILYLIKKAPPVIQIHLSAKYNISNILQQQQQKHYTPCLCSDITVVRMDG